MPFHLALFLHLLELLFYASLFKVDNFVSPTAFMPSVNVGKTTRLLTQNLKNK